MWWSTLGRRTAAAEACKVVRNCDLALYNLDNQTVVNDSESITIDYS